MTSYHMDYGEMDTMCANYSMEIETLEYRSMIMIMIRIMMIMVIM